MFGQRPVSGETLLKILVSVIMSRLETGIYYAREYRATTRAHVTSRLGRALPSKYVHISVFNPLGDYATVISFTQAPRNWILAFAPQLLDVLSVSRPIMC